MIKTKTQFLSTLTLMMVAYPLYAANWTITPSINLQETYTDNVTLASSGQEQDDFIAEINPAISIKGKGKRLKLDFSYRMQNLIYANDNDRNSTSHQLRANANAELVEKFLFLDATGSIGQRAISNTGRVSVDNLSVTGNRTDVATYSLSPYITHRFGGYVDSELRYTFSGTESDQGASDSDTSEISLSLSSGRKFSKLRWNLNYNKRDLGRDTVNDADYESSRGEVRYAVHRKLDVVAQAGTENNSFNNTINTNDGTYWSAGFDWHPSRKISLQLLKGDDDQSATLRVNPSERTTLETTYRDTEIGLNTGGTWAAMFNHRTRRSTWQLNYSEDTTTFQEAFFQLNELGQELLLEAIDVYQSGDQDLINAFESENAGIEFDDIFSATDEVFISKRLQGSVQLNTAKSNIRFSIFNEKREFLVVGDDEDSVGGAASWNWRFAPRTSALLKGTWSQTDFRSSTREDERWDVGLGITREIRREVKGSVDLRHVENKSDTAANSYEENRVSVRLNISF